MIIPCFNDDTVNNNLSFYASFGQCIELLISPSFGNCEVCSKNKYFLMLVNETY
uniref:Uncharacterized protein n=1 Tax=Arundo donax TaxID=35708 RepID=A0A0A9HPJ0_ARUDO